MIRGNSGSGKTTVAKKLQHQLGPNTMVISQDVIRREIYIMGERWSEYKSAIFVIGDADIWTEAL